MLQLAFGTFDEGCVYRLTHLEMLPDLVRFRASLLCCLASCYSRHLSILFFRIYATTTTNLIRIQLRHNNPLSIHHWSKPKGPPNLFISPTQLVQMRCRLPAPLSGIGSLANRTFVLHLTRRHPSSFVVRVVSRFGRKVVGQTGRAKGVNAGEDFCVFEGTAADRAHEGAADFVDFGAEGEDHFGGVRLGGGVICCWFCDWGRVFWWCCGFCCCGSWYGWFGCR
mmetsp:Transcript_13658/g.28999  ORF Transcript_13658/g.28999 Transcript_13658/m.28999 type:complete len:224 (+) Transcript_13658:1347-2018(+)